MNNDPLKALRSLSAERLNASETKAAAAPANSTPARADNETGTADRVKSRTRGVHVLGQYSLRF